VVWFCRTIFIALRERWWARGAGELVDDGRYDLAWNPAWRKNDPRRIRVELMPFQGWGLPPNTWRKDLSTRKAATKRKGRRRTSIYQF